MTGSGGGEVHFFSGKSEWPVENHFDSAALAQFGVGPASKKNRGESATHARGGSDQSSRAGVTGGRTGDGAARRAAAASGRHSVRIAALVGIGDHLAFPLIQL